MTEITPIAEPTIPAIAEPTIPADVIGNTLTDQLVIDTVTTNPGKPVGEIRKLVKVQGITKSEINKVLYRLEKGKRLSRKVMDGENAPLWFVAGE